MSTILITEDNERNLKLVRDILRYHGHDTLEARSGEECVCLALCHQPDLILMDILLPGMNGIAALQRIREHRALDGIPVIALSASVMPDDQHRILHSGFDACMTKPISLKPFLAVVDRLLHEVRST